MRTGKAIAGPEKMLMNPHTGTVQSVSDWEADGVTCDTSELIEVVKNDTGDWVASRLL